MRTAGLQQLRNISLRKRILILFVLAVFVPFSITVWVSYKNIQSTIATQIEEGAQSDLHQQLTHTEYVMDTLAQVSQQFIYPSNIARNIGSYLEADDTAELLSRSEEIKRELDYISYSNASVGLAVYMTEEEEPVFQNMLLRDSFDIDNLPYLGRYGGYEYYGPHISMNPLNTQYVISISRDIYYPNGDYHRFYLEGNYREKTTSGEETMTDRSFRLLLNKEGEIVHSELARLFEPGSQFNEGDITEASGRDNGYFWFRDTSRHGWSIVSLIPSSEYIAARDSWMSQMAVLAAVFVLATLFIASLLRMMVYRPLLQFQGEIEAVTNQEWHSSAQRTKIPEFDNVLDQLDTMKGEIRALLTEVQEKEKHRADLEIEKLKYQINPHFLMNTLDTVHWLAVLHKQKDIDRIVTSLNKLLYYNLKKKGDTASLREELQAVENYFILQQVRYSFDYSIHADIRDSMLDTLVPRFILQPLAENAIFHGLEDEGHIDVHIYVENASLVLAVRDNGHGLTNSETERLLQDDTTNREGIGIGFSYVKKMIAVYYNGEAHIEIESEKEAFSIVKVIIPLSEVKKHSA
ncbi:sensor histidine kinase [Alkalicoccus halolimnae]|uniref:Histidine kinase n=1 Tax=Alkalicoccus halolimnae TaxID=1667239 RepID=A0A5C7F4H8_9BACI|nr:histidine kinase [Alkalicoccus halolimnae]TXF85561.1 sensor histidine kinase [Alkalicoccus halolimnae]